LRKLSIAAKLYAVFAIMAIITLAVAGMTAMAARQHAALTSSFSSDNAGSINVERVSALIYAIEAQSEAIFLAPDRASAAEAAKHLNDLNDRLGALMAEWQVGLGDADTDAVQFSAFALQVNDFQQYLTDFADVAAGQGGQAARDWTKTHSSTVSRDDLARDLAQLSNAYASKASKIYARINSSINATAASTALLAGLTLLLAVGASFLVTRGVTGPIRRIAKITEQVASGNVETVVPYGTRRDEIGALSRSIAVFQQAMRRNVELNRTVTADAEARSVRQQQVNAEIARFSGDVESTLAELGRIADEMLGAAHQLSTTAADASSKTARATTASAEASSNVRDIASAADELSASVSEIDRQVAQANMIANRAVTDAERSGLAVKELNAAASRIGDVIKLITDIAEQTNLLALNATIEAARAGDAGRGFAVVANEVKALAGQTARATQEIGAQIASMQHATSNSIEAINAIGMTIREIGDISGAIAAAVTEQGAATQEIARAVETAAQRTADTANDVTQVGEATEDTHASANTVKAVADNLGQVAQRIRGQVDQFFQRLSA
jgi:methyl-accepting chemotaxis protein